MVKCELFQLWAEKEKQEGRRITIGEVAKATNLSRDAVSGLYNGTTTRFDGEIVAKVCQFFDIPEGDPIPFLKVYY